MRFPRLASSILVLGFLSLAACGGDNEGNGEIVEIEGPSEPVEVLEGAISDDMLALDELRSQAPLAEIEPEGEGDDEEEGSSNSSASLSAGARASSSPAQPAPSASASASQGAPSEAGTSTAAPVSAPAPSAPASEPMAESSTEAE